jgi:hypothetical protein
LPEPPWVRPIIRWVVNEILSNLFLLRRGQTNALPRENFNPDSPERSRPRLDERGPISINLQQKGVEKPENKYPKKGDIGLKERNLKCGVVRFLEESEERRAFKDVQFIGDVQF